MTKPQLPIRDICTIGIFAALTVVLAQLAVPLPITPMPISFGLVGVYITGILLRPKCAVCAQLCYLLLGAVGLPVFGNFRGGMGALFGPTGGYLFVYPLMAAIVSLTLNSDKSLRPGGAKKRPYRKAVAAICTAHLVLYLGGTIWLAATSANTFAGALALAVLPFIPMDILKIVFCVTAMLPFRDRLIKMKLLTVESGAADSRPVRQTGSAGGEDRDACAQDILQWSLEGQIPTEDQAHILMDPDQTPLEDLIQAANALTRRHTGNEIDLCAIYAAKVGRCSGDCAFCAQSAHHACDVTPVNTRDLDVEEIVAYAMELRQLGVSRLSLVTSGERLTDSEFDHILHIYRRLRGETEIGLCASCGALDARRAAELKAAGVTRYHHNLETAQSFFPQICSTHSYEDKLNTIRIAREAGMEVCSGGIISMGETPRQRVEMAFALGQLDVDCVPLNILNPIPGTRLEQQPILPVEELLRTIAVFRLILRDKTLRFAGGRENAMGNEEYAGYTAGVNAMIIGDYLTTRGKDWKRELQNMEANGFVRKGRLCPSETKTGVRAGRQ